MSGPFEELPNWLEALKAMPGGRPLLDSCARVRISASRGVEESANPERTARPIRSGTPGVKGTLIRQATATKHLKAISVDWGCAPGEITDTGGYLIPGRFQRPRLRGSLHRMLAGRMDSPRCSRWEITTLEGLHTPLLISIVISIRFSLVFGLEDIPLSHPLSSQPRERDGQYACNEAPTRSTAARNPSI